MERYSLITTPVNRALTDLLHHVFGAAAGELTNLINFLVVRIFPFSFFFVFLLFTVNFLGSYSFMRRSKILGEFVPEIERFLHKRKREARNNNGMAAERTLKEYATPSTQEPHAIIVYPTVEGNNFEIKPALIYFFRITH